MSKFAEFSISDWLIMGMTLIGYMYIVVKSCQWLISLIIDKCHRFIIRKDRKQLAINDLFDAFDFDETCTTTARTGGGWVLTVRKVKP